MTSDDGIQRHKFTEPTGSPAYRGPIEKTWRQDSAKSPKLSRKTETWLNAHNKPVKEQRLLANGDPCAEQRYEYDGLGNCRLHTNERGYTTRFAYDAWDRMTHTILTDGTQVTRTYAEHTTKALPIAVDAGKPDILMHRLGSQTFDGIDRLSSRTTGNRTEQLFYKKGMTHPARQISAKGDEIKHHYTPQLIESPRLTETPEGEANFTFNTTSARLERASNRHGFRSYEYDWNNRIKMESWGENQDTPLYSISQGISLHGRLCWQKIENGPDSIFTYDEFGRPEKTIQGNLESTFSYDTLGQLKHVTLLDLESKETLVTTFTYDDQGREKQRTFKRRTGPERSIEQEWKPGNLLTLRHLKEGSTSLLKEEFTYDERGRLHEHLCSGRDLPRDEQDLEYIKQAFDYDGLNNISLRTTTLKDQTQHTASFTYKYEEADYKPEEHDPCQLAKVVYSPSRPAPPARFDYDPNGCQLNDEKGRAMRYDSEKRLLHVSKVLKNNEDSYRYDARGHLISSKQAADVDDALLYFEKNRLRLAIRGKTQTHLLHAGDLPLGQQQAGDPATTRMFSCTASGSVIADSPEPTAGYSAYGQRFGALASLLGFNGEYLDPNSGWYLLGRGHRAYNPALMRFQAPDTLSPFGEGDINRYAYCQGNPITFTDPTGRASRGIAEKGERGLAQRGERGVELTPEQLWLIANRPSLDWVGIMMESINLVLSYAVAAIMVASAILTAGVTAPMAAMAVANAALQTVSFVGSLVYQTSGYTNEAAMEVTKYANYVGTPLSIIDIALSVKGPKANTSPTPPNVTNPAIQDRTPRTSVSSNINDGANSPNDIRRGSAGE